MQIHATTSRTLASTSKPYVPHILINAAYGCRYLILFHMLLLFSKVEPSHSDWLMDCGDCRCKWNSGKKTADCRNLSLASVPENLSSELQVLDLSFNHIPYLEENAFLSAQLHNLHKLFIRNSSLQNIDPRSFSSLEILIELDLSNNLLRALRANLFARLPKVRALVLNGNLLESLGDGIFQNLKYLHKIELKHNHIVRIGTQVFSNVPLLTQIYLDGNQLSFLRKESFETLKRLTALSLDQNPWNCTCELQVFRDFVLKRNLYTPPTSCYYPAHLRGMLWVEDQPEAFACKPRIIYPSRGASINTSKENVTLICRVHASPNTLIAWDYNKQMYRANVAQSGQQRVHIQLLRDEQSKEKEFGRDVFISRLTIVGAEKSDEGTYTCLAENAGGKDAVQMSLLVQKPGPKDILLQGNMIIVISLMALGLLSVSVFLAMVTCCIYKRFKAINPGHHRHHHLDVGNAMSTTVDSTTTPVVGGTDVSLGVTPDSVAANHHHYNNIYHSSKLNGGGVGGMNADAKYSEAFKHGITVKDNCTVSGNGGHQLLLSSSQMDNVENAYLEKKHEDSIHIKYPHGQSLSEVHRIISSSNNMDCQRSELSFELGVGSEFQPDLLPAYNKNNNNSHNSNNSNNINSNQQGHLNSPTRIINQQQKQQQQQHHHGSQLQLQQLHQDNQQATKPLSTSTLQSVLKGKYNSNTQEYLMARLGTANNIGHMPNKSNSSKHEMPSILLTTSASLSASTDNNTTATTTLQRHSKSLVVPHRITTPTESGYEYRQPPPPPYYSAHHTTSNSNLLMRLRTSSSKDDGGECKDPGYRDECSSSKKNESGLETINLSSTLTRQTIVTASPSLNFLTTTDCTPPRRQLL